MNPHCEWVLKARTTWAYFGYSKGLTEDATAGSPLCSFQDMGHENRRSEKLPPLSKTLKKKKKTYKFATMELRQPSLPPFQIFRRILIYPSSLNVESWIWDRRSPERGLVLVCFVFFLLVAVFLHGLRHAEWTMQCWPLRLFDDRKVGFYLTDLMPLLKHVFPQCLQGLMCKKKSMYIYYLYH